MTNAAHRHTNHETSAIHTCASSSESHLRCLIDELVERWVDVVGKLNFRNRLHALRRSTNREAHNCLFTQRCIEHSFGPEVCGEIHAAAEYTAKGDIFAE